MNDVLWFGGGMRISEDAPKIGDILDLLCFSATAIVGGSPGPPRTITYGIPKP
jgi:hypothetical protein